MYTSCPTVWSFPCRVLPSKKNQTEEFTAKILKQFDSYCPKAKSINIIFCPKKLIKAAKDIRVNWINNYLSKVGMRKKTKKRKNKLKNKMSFRKKKKNMNKYKKKYIKKKRKPTAKQSTSFQPEDFRSG